MEAPEMLHVLTIGHSNRTWKEFLELLRAHRVKRVIDVRSIPPIETQSSVQPGNPVYKAASRRDRLRAFAKDRGLVPCTTGFAEHGLARFLISWFRGLYADFRV
jgi:hypothetical protein